MKTEKEAVSPKIRISGRLVKQVVYEGRERIKLGQEMGKLMGSHRFAYPG